MKLQTHSFGDYNFVPHAVFPSVTAAAVTPHRPPGGGAAPGAPSWDYIVVTTKALPDRGDDSATIAPLVGPASCIVLIQNGVGVEEPYRRRFPDNPIVSAVTVVSAEQLQRGVIRQNRWTRIHLGPYTDSASGSDADADLASTQPVTSASRRSSSSGNLASRGAACTRQLADWFARLGGVHDAEALDEVDLQTVRWHKLCINAAMNASAVLSGGRGPADMAADPELRVHLAAVMHEVFDAAPRILGRPFPPHMAGPEKIIASAARNAGARPSMLLDWEAGRPLEIEVILGNPLRIARARGVEMPRVQSLYALLRSAMQVREEREREAKGRRRGGQGKGKL